MSSPHDRGGKQSIRGLYERYGYSSWRDAVTGAEGAYDEDRLRGLHKVGLVEAANALEAEISRQNDEWYARLKGADAGSPSTFAHTKLIREIGALGASAKPAVPKLIEALHDPSGDVRAAAAEALGQIGPAAAEALDALTRAANDPKLGIAASAEKAIVRIRGR